MPSCTAHQHGSAYQQNFRTLQAGLCGHQRDVSAYLTTLAWWKPLDVLLSFRVHGQRCHWLLLLNLGDHQQLPGFGPPHLLFVLALQHRC